MSLYKLNKLIFPLDVPIFLLYQVKVIWDDFRRQYYVLAKHALSWLIARSLVWAGLGAISYAVTPMLYPVLGLKPGFVIVLLWLLGHLVLLRPIHELITTGNDVFDEILFPRLILSGLILGIVTNLVLCNCFY